MNKVTLEQSQPPGRLVRDFKSGTIVSCADTPHQYFIVLEWKDNPSKIGAVALGSGGYITPDTAVVALGIGSRLVLEVQS